MKRLWFLLAFVVLFTMACSLTSLLPTGENNAPAATPLPPTARPTAQPQRPTSQPRPTSPPKPTAAPPQQNNVLFRDDFSNPKSGWDRVHDSETGNITDYDHGHYRILVNEPRTDVWANPGRYFEGDVVVKVDALPNNGPEDDDFGLICRYEDPSNYYFFVISSDGYAGIGKMFHDEQIMLTGGGNMIEVPIPKGSKKTYHLRAACVGSRLTLFVNGKQILEATDTDLTAGDVGLMAGTFDEPGTDILFDNLVVRRP